MPNLHKQLPKAKTPHERDQWPKQYKWLRKHVEKMYAVFKPPVEEYEAEQQA